MTRKTASPEQITEMLALREAGYTVLAISQRLHMSVRTIQRYLATHGAKKGSLKQDVIDTARAELFKFVTSNPAIREEAAKLISDDLAHSKHLRAIMLDASELLKATTPQEAMLVLRAAAAYSTALKNTSDTIRHALGIDKLIEGTDELPELIITELTSEQIEAMAASQIVKKEEA